MIYPLYYTIDRVFEIQYRLFFVWHITVLLPWVPLYCIFPMSYINCQLCKALCTFQLEWMFVLLWQSCEVPAPNWWWTEGPCWEKSDSEQREGKAINVKFTVSLVGLLMVLGQSITLSIIELRMDPPNSGMLCSWGCQKAMLWNSLPSYSGCRCRSKLSGGKSSPEVVVNMASLPQSTTWHLSHL